LIRLPNSTQPSLAADAALANTSVLRLLDCAMPPIVVKTTTIAAPASFKLFIIVACRK